MKKCKYCDTECNDELTNCPACGGNEFKHKCPSCGMISETPFCPNCGVKSDAKRHVCPICGNSFFTNACPSCGYTINKANSQEKAAQIKVTRPIVIDNEVKESVVNATKTATKTATKAVSKTFDFAVAALGYFFCFFCFFAAFTESFSFGTIGFIVTAILALPFTKTLIRKNYEGSEKIGTIFTARAILVFVLFIVSVLATPV